MTARNPEKLRDLVHLLEDGFASENLRWIGFNVRADFVDFSQKDSLGHV